MSTISSLVRSDSGEQLEQQVGAALCVVRRVCAIKSMTLLQAVAIAAENKRIFTPLSGPLPAPQVEPASSEWALDVVTKGALLEFTIGCMFLVTIPCFTVWAGFSEFQLGGSANIG
jgi:hypothetical protein